MFTFLHSSLSNLAPRNVKTRTRNNLIRVFLLSHIFRPSKGPSIKDVSIGRGKTLVKICRGKYVKDCRHGEGGVKITRKFAEVVYGRPPTQLLNMVTTLLLFAACNHMGSVFGRKLEIYNYVLVKE